MQKRCVICEKRIQENCGKFKGTIIKVRNEKKKIKLIYVCSECQKKDNWIEVAKIRGV